MESWISDTNQTYEYGVFNTSSGKKYTIQSSATMDTEARETVMGQLTDRQQQVLDCIKGHIREHGFPPTRMEVAQAVGLKDASTISGHLAKLAEAGRVELQPNKKRGIRVLDTDLPLVGPVAEVAAGTPIVAESHVVERIPAAVADRFRPRPDYFLTVRGDSMDRTGLRDGDVVAVRATSEARSGDVVVARFGDEVTLKRFRRIDRRNVELVPESSNPEHEPTRLDLAKHILHIDGVMVGALIGVASETTMDLDHTG